jgi:hypothetical protein
MKKFSPNPVKPPPTLLESIKYLGGLHTEETSFKKLIS